MKLRTPIACATVFAVLGAAIYAAIQYFVERAFPHVRAGIPLWPLGLCVGAWIGWHAPRVLRKR